MSLAPDDDTRGRIAEKLDLQAMICGRLGSPLYADLLRMAAQDVRLGGPTWPVLEPSVRRGSEAAIALRLMAAVHRMVLEDLAPELDRFYPSVGGTPGEGVWPAFRSLLEDRRDAVAGTVGLPCQTNEVGRCAALLFAFLEVAARHRKPLRLLELGASAGLNLRFDTYRYEGGGAAWGHPDAYVRLPLWDDAPPHVSRSIEVASREGCDPDPVNPRSKEGRVALRSSVWADQIARLERLNLAIALAPTVPAQVDPAPLERWLPPKLAAPVAGVVTVVFHSVIEEYLSDEARRTLASEVERAGRNATRRARGRGGPVQAGSGAERRTGSRCSRGSPFWRRLRAAFVGSGDRAVSFPAEAGDRFVEP